MKKQILNILHFLKAIFTSTFFAYWLIAGVLVVGIIYNYDINFLSEGGKAAPEKGEFGHKGIVGELETEISSDNKYDGIEGQIYSLNKSQNKNIYISELDKDGLVGYANSVAISKEGFPVISYHHLNAGDLKLAYCQDTDCSKAKIHLLDWAGDFGYYTDIASSNSGKIYVSYIDRKKGDLRVIRCLDSKCGRAQINVIDRGEGQGGYVGEYNSLAITKDGRPIISYFDSSKNDLKIASCDDNECTSFTNRSVVTEGMVGEYADMILSELTDYPITDIQFESSVDPVIEKKYDVAFREKLKLKSLLIEIGLDYFTYGNCFISSTMAPTRFVVFPNGDKFLLKTTKFKVKNFKIIAIHPETNVEQEVKLKDEYIKTIDNLKFVRWSPENIDIDFNPISGNSTYYYNMPASVKRKLAAGNKTLLLDIPLVFIDLKELIT